jgi:hypothetical protein
MADINYRGCRGTKIGDGTIDWGIPSLFMSVAWTGLKSKRSASDWTAWSGRTTA